MNLKVDKSLEAVRERESYSLEIRNNAFLNALLVVAKSNSVSLCLLTQKININKEKVKDSSKAY